MKFASHASSTSMLLISPDARYLLAVPVVLIPLPMRAHATLFLCTSMGLLDNSFHRPPTLLSGFRLVASPHENSRRMYTLPGTTRYHSQPTTPPKSPRPSTAPKASPRPPTPRARP